MTALETVKMRDTVLLFKLVNCQTQYPYAFRLLGSVISVQGNFDII